MKTLSAFLLCLSLLNLALAEKKLNIVGTWVIHPETVAQEPRSKGFQLVFRKDGTFSMNGFNTVGEGKYEIQPERLVLTLTKRNGLPPTDEKEKSARASIGPGARSIYIDSGIPYKGKTVILRFVRKESLKK